MNKLVKRLNLFILFLVPSFITLLLLLISVTPIPLWGANYITPLFPLISIFYWERYKNRYIPFTFIFVIGLLHDAMIGNLIGISSLLYIIFVTIIYSNNRRSIGDNSFIGIWGYFAILLIIISAIKWVIMSFSGNYISAILPVILQVLITICFYPIFHKLFDGLTKSINQKRRVLING